MSTTRVAQSGWRWERAAAWMSLLASLACSSSDEVDADPQPTPDVPSAEPEGGGDGPEGPQTPVGPIACQHSDECPEALPVCGSKGECVECAGASDCQPGWICFHGTCAEGLCPPDSRTCVGERLLVCDAAGGSLYEVDCAPGTCEAGECRDCTPGTYRCGGPVLLVCEQDTTSFAVAQTCQTEALCDAPGGKCNVCVPKTGRCEGPNVYRCSDDGTAETLEQTCGVGESCVLGTCRSACDLDLKLNTNVGCDYWAVDLDNFYDPATAWSAANAPFAVVVSSASPEPAEVKVYNSDSEEPYTEAIVPAGALHVFELPPRNVDGPVKAKLAWRIKSTAPIVAYQFNPLDNVDVFSNDASVLFPATSWGSHYLAMSWRQFSASTVPPTLNGFVTVVAAFPNTEVTVVPTGQTRGHGDVPALAAGESWKTTLQPYEVLNIESGGVGVDLTGTSISATRPIGVFGGHECARTSQNTCCCDHLEQQLLPTATWGREHVAIRSAPRRLERDHWRVLALEDGTTVTTSPKQVEPFTLGKGQYKDFQSDTSFLIESTRPVMVGQFLASSFEMNGSCDSGCSPQTTCNTGQGLCWPVQGVCSGTGQSSCLAGHTCVNGNCEPIGDPAFIIMPPVEQFLSDYVFLTPDNYVANYLGVVAPRGTIMILDEATTVAPTPLTPTSDWATALLPLEVGTHTIRSIGEVPFGIVVHGYDDDVSYGYTGGLGLEVLTPTRPAE